MSEEVKVAKTEATQKNEKDSSELLDSETEQIVGATKPDPLLPAV